MNRISDVEKELKARLREVSGAELVASAEEVQQLLDRLDNYRQRIQERQKTHHVELSKLQIELNDHRRCIAWARERMDPENKGTHYSLMDIYEVAEHIKAIEKMRGKIVTSRLLYGAKADDICAEETIGVLKAAIADAKNEEARWRRYLAEAHAKEKANNRV
ncbi:MAG: hypothetical protein AB7L09_01360 [Nitrospira sp.]